MSEEERNNQLELQLPLEEDIWDDSEFDKHVWKLVEEW